MPQIHLFSIDTLQFSKRLQKAGMQEEIADELAEAFKENHSQSLEGLATKQDLENLSSRTKQDLEILRRDLTIKMGTIMSIGITIIAILIKF